MSRIIFIILIALFIPAAAFAAKNSAANRDITINADGYDITGGTTSPRKLTVTGGDVTLTGGGSAAITFPSSASDTLVGRVSVDTLTNKTITGLALTAGTTSVAPLTIAFGSKLTTPAAGALEFDGTSLYFNSVSGSGSNGQNKVTYGNVAVLGSATLIGIGVVVDISGLNIPVGANETWEFEFHVSSNDQNGIGFNFAVAIPSGTLEAQIFGTTSTLTANRQERLTTSGAITSGKFSTTASIDGVEWVSGVCTTGSTGGNINFRAYLSGGSVAGTAAYKGSYSIARRIG